MEMVPSPLMEAHETNRDCRGMDLCIELGKENAKTVGVQYIAPLLLYLFQKTGGV